MMMKWCRPRLWRLVRPGSTPFEEWEASIEERSNTSAPPGSKCGRTDMRKSERMPLERREEGEREERAVEEKGPVRETSEPSFKATGKGCVCVLCSGGCTARIQAMRVRGNGIGLDLWELSSAGASGWRDPKGFGPFHITQTRKVGQNKGVSLGLGAR